MSERLLTARELADHLGLSTNAVLDRWEQGDLPGYRLFGRKGGPVRFRLSEVETLLAGWRSPEIQPKLEAPDENGRAPR